MATRAVGGRTNGHLTKDELFAKLTIPEEDYALPGGGTIRLRGLDVQQGAPFASGLGKDGDNADRLKRLCLLGIVDPKLEPEDLEAISGGSLEIVSGIAVAVMRLSGMWPGEAEDFFEQTQQPKVSSSTARKRSGGSRQK